MHCMYRNGKPFGTCWKLFRCGGCVVGPVDSDGELTGSDLAYIYPDLSTALVGTFEKGEFVSGQISSLVSIRLDYGAIQVTNVIGESCIKLIPKVPTFTAGEGPLLKREISTNEKVQ